MADDTSSTLRAPPAQLDLPALEETILRLWSDNAVEARSLQAGARAARGEADRAAFVFFDGPPFATGLPHYGHILPGTIKDIVPRYQCMKGYAVERRFGWDCHGLPIESLVENELGVHGRAEIEALGIAEFNAACRAGVLRFTEEWEQTVRRMGRWVDFENDYKTMDPSFMETVWWVFSQLWEKGWIYESHRVQPVSPVLGTPLSNFEVAQGPQERDPVTRKEGHKRRQDPSLTVRFRLEDEDAFVWAWTTTPWTLPSNLALAVHPDVEYVKVKIEATGEVAYVEPGRLAEYQEHGKVGKTEELARMKGSTLVGRPYEPLFPYFAELKTRDDGSRWAFRVVGAEYVTIDSGTGIVHQAPGFGEDDYQVGRAEGLPVVVPVDLQGIFDARVTDFAGQFVKDADKAIAHRLKEEGKVVDQDVIVHPYPHCYRTEEPLHLHGALHLVHAGRAAARATGRAQRHDPLGARARRDGPLRQLARRRSRLEPGSQPPARTLPMVHTCAGRDNVSRHASNCGPPSTSSTTSAPNRGQKRHAANLPRPARRPGGETRRPSTSSPLRNCRSRSGLPRAGPPGKPPRRYSSARKRSNTTCTTSTASSPSARGAPNSSGQ